MRADSRLDALLEHAGIWRAGNSEGTRFSVIPTGFAALNQRLPGGGWPERGLIELLLDKPGTCELGLLLPALVEQQGDRWLMLVAPPHEPYAPALAARGIDLERLLVIRTAEVLWTMEQALNATVCRVVVGWSSEERPARLQWLRRLQLAALQAGCLAVLCRPRHAARESSPALLRLELEPATEGCIVRVIKSRGGPLGSVCLHFDQ